MPHNNDKHVTVKKMCLLCKWTIGQRLISIKVITITYLLHVKMKHLLTFSFVASLLCQRFASSLSKNSRAKFSQGYRSTTILQIINAQNSCPIFLVNKGRLLIEGKMKSSIVIDRNRKKPLSFPLTQTKGYNCMILLIVEWNNKASPLIPFKEPVKSFHNDNGFLKAPLKGARDNGGTINLQVSKYSLLLLIPNRYKKQIVQDMLAIYKSIALHCSF